MRDFFLLTAVALGGIGMGYGLAQWGPKTLTISYLLYIIGILIGVIGLLLTPTKRDGE